MRPYLELVNVTKRFGNFTANKNVCIRFDEGEVHALLGENGAGKTTLMNIIYGLLQPDEGAIYYKGNFKEVTISSPRDAIQYGIGMVHQHFMLVPTLTVTENIMLMLSVDEDAKFLLDEKAVSDRIRELSQKYGMDVDPSALVKDLSVGQQQRVEIIKAIYRDCGMLILDEPTAVLTPGETEELFEIIRKFREENKAVVYISHKLNELMNISDKITVLRRGEVIKTVQTDDVDADELAFLMVGKKVDLRMVKNTPPQEEIALDIEDLSVEINGVSCVNQLGLHIHKGEIYGIAGVDGNGQGELVKSIFAMLPKKSGKITLFGEDISEKSTAEILKRKAAHIPEDRQKYGGVIEMSVVENLFFHCISQKRFRRGPLIRKQKMLEESDRMIEKYDIRLPNRQVSFDSLSGGNQQKVIVARELEKEPEFLVAVYPTRGVDVGAIEFIHKAIVNARNRGAAVLLVSTELDEVMSLSDRIGVMYKGSIIGEVSADKARVETIGKWMVGNAKT